MNADGGVWVSLMGIGITVHRFSLDESKDGF